MPEPTTPPRIVVLDGFTTTPHIPGEPAPAGEPSWDALAQLGDLTVYPRTPDSQRVERAAGAPVVILNKSALSAEHLAALPELRYVGLLSTGTNAVDLAAAREHGVTVCNVPAYSSASVAQHVFAMLLSLTNQIDPHNRAVHDGQWANCNDFCFTLDRLDELEGKTFGIVGAGDIGQAALRIAHGFGMKLATHSRTRRELGLPVQWMELDELFATADVISLHCPLNAHTEGMVNADRLATMKPTSVLINTGRGQLIDEPALAHALAEGQLAAACLDVLSTEPPSPDNPLLGEPRCIITPHIAWATAAARTRLMGVVVNNLKQFLAGSPVNVVS